MKKIKHFDLNHPDTTINRKDEIEKKPFMRRMYVEWYQLLKQSLPAETKCIVELGSGPGFISEIIPQAISSDILFLPYLDVVMNGRLLPLRAQCLDALLMMDVFHHISDAESFFYEVDRVLRVGGRLVMIEPWVTAWSKWVFTRFHHEPINMEVTEWAFKPDGPLTGANQALPWIVFDRDRSQFEKKFSNMNVLQVLPMMPLTYMLGGGFSHHVSLPEFTYPFFRNMEKRLMHPNKNGMFALIVVEKIK